MDKLFWGKLCLGGLLTWGPRASARPQTVSTKARSDLLSIVHALIQDIIIPFCAFSDQKYTKYIAIIKYM